MKLSILKKHILLLLAKGRALPSDVWLHAMRVLPRGVTNRKFHQILGELAATGLVVYDRRPLTDREIEQLLASLTRPSRRVRLLRKRDYVWLTRDGHHIADLLTITEMVRPNLASRARLILRMAMQRVCPLR